MQSESESESESDNATEGVIWKARDLWSAPVEWSNHGMQAQKSSESMWSSAATCGGHPPSGGCCAMSVRQHVVVKGCAPQSRRVGCHRRASASVLHAGAGSLRTRTPAAPSVGKSLGTVTDGHNSRRTVSNRGNVPDVNIPDLAVLDSPL